MIHIRRIALLLLCIAFGPIASAADLLPADSSIPQAIDHYVDAKLKSEGVQPADRADDATLIRRLTLDLAGRTPTATEARAYVASKEKDKYVKLVDRLMSSRSFVRHQVDVFDAMLMRTANGKPKSLAAYLEVAIAENRPWDKMFRELISADGASDQTKGAQEYLRSTVRDIDLMANKVSVDFFGINISCAKCHDHPLVLDWTQDHFYGMKSFFNRTFENGDFIGEEEYGYVSFQTVDGDKRAAKLMFLDGKPIDEPQIKEPDDKTKKELKKRRDEFRKKKQPLPPPSFSRRMQLIDAALSTGNDQFLARSIVNRVWHQLVGQGLVMPLDQMHSMNAPSHPELLEWLSRDLIANGYDLRRLMRGIVASKTYQRASRWNGSSEDRPTPKLFAVANVKPLTPRQYAIALRMAGQDPAAHRADTPEADFEKWVEGVEGGARGLAGKFEYPGQRFQVSVDEALMLSNDENLQRELMENALVRHLRKVEDDRELIESAVWSVLSRPTDDEERRAFAAYLAQRKDQRDAAVAQIVWAMMTSGEARFNH